MSIKELFEKSIYWEKKEGEWFVVSIDNEIFKLKMNDFPDEPMYTLCNKNESIDFDDKPKIWEIKST